MIKASIDGQPVARKGDVKDISNAIREAGSKNFETMAKLSTKDEEKKLFTKCAAEDNKTLGELEPLKEGDAKNLTKDTCEMFNTKANYFKDHLKQYPCKKN